MNIRIQEAVFDPWAEISAYQAGSPELASKHGATGVFVGTLRDRNAGRAVQAMNLEHYPVMTEKHLEKVCQEAGAQWQLLDLLLIHRTGRILPDEPIVLVACWAVHRADALDACRYIIDELKTRAPFWKLETTSEGQRWVEPEQSGKKNS
ncbi:MAG: molybdopterin synthase catalytic subunit MoaE [Gammaproteobacteria bacterium]|nr:MAG: molybdopterin synthase catalytic subunit MoaE [Gammaproteobacteria bacterium]